MFLGGYFPTSYYPPSYFPKTGAPATVGALSIGGRRFRNEILAEIDSARRERKRQVGRRMSYRTFVEAMEQMVVHSEIKRRQQLLTTAAYSVLLGEI